MVQKAKYKVKGVIRSQKETRRKKLVKTLHRRLKGNIAGHTENYKQTFEPTVILNLTITTELSQF